MGETLISLDVGPKKREKALPKGGVRIGRREERPNRGSSGRITTISIFSRIDHEPSRKEGNCQGRGEWINRSNVERTS